MEVGKINNVTIERTPSGKYFVVLNVDFEPTPNLNKGGSIGIDVGIKDFYSDSNGNVVHNPKYLEKSMRKLIREQRKLSRKQKGSNNRNKQRIKVALVHEKITNQRNDFLQKQSTMLVRENQTICIEDLNVKGMMKNKHLSEKIKEAKFYEFRRQLEYKCKWNNVNLIIADRWYPSSKLCSSCGNRKKKLSLSERIYVCEECGCVIDRDYNASLNLKYLAM